MFYKEVTEYILKSNFLIITAGAGSYNILNVIYFYILIFFFKGIGVDSGLPDFRGTNGKKINNYFK